jgi:hypothetical protein
VTIGMLYRAVKVQLWDTQEPKAEKHRSSAQEIRFLFPQHSFAISATDQKK